VSEAQKFFISGVELHILTLLSITSYLLIPPRNEICRIDGLDLELLAHALDMLYRNSPDGRLLRLQVAAGCYNQVEVGLGIDVLSLDHSALVLELQIPNSLLLELVSVEVVSICLLWATSCVQDCQQLNSPLFLYMARDRSWLFVNSELYGLHF